MNKNSNSWENIEFQFSNDEQTTKIDSRVRKTIQKQCECIYKTH